jgi:hypothetical protein
MLKRAYLPAVLVALSLNTAVAQDRPSTLEPGAPVRVTAHDLGIEKQQATFQALRGDTLAVTADSAMALSLSSVTRLDVYRGQKSNLLLGMGVGFGAGAGLGALVGATVDCENGFGNEETCVGLGAAGGAVVGLLVGTTAGLLIKSDRWEEVPLDRLRVSFAPHDGELVLGISLAL